MKRNRYLVAYDIRDPVRLRQVAKVMLGFGSRLQYSVFVCDLSHAELCDLKMCLRDVANLGVDSVMFAPLGEGYDPKCFEFMGPARPLPPGGPIVV